MNLTVNSPWGYDRNDPGRHRLKVADKARELYDREAKERQKEGQERGRQKQKGIVENFPQPNPDSGKARDQVGKVFNVSGKSVDHAARVRANAVPEVVQAVEHGRQAFNFQVPHPKYR